MGSRLVLGQTRITRLESAEVQAENQFVLFCTDFPVNPEASQPVGWGGEGELRTADWFDHCY